MLHPRSYPWGHSGWKVTRNEENKNHQRDREKITFSTPKKCIWDVHCFRFAPHIRTIMMKSLSIRMCLLAVPGMVHGDISSRTETDCWQCQCVYNGSGGRGWDTNQSRWHKNEVQDNGQGEGHSFLRAAGPWYKACKGSCPVLQPLTPQNLRPKQLCSDHIYSRTCPSKSGPYCSCINLWSELNPLRQKDYTSIAVIKSLSQLATGRWEGSLVVMQLSSNNPALSGSHIQLKKPRIFTRHAIVLISSIGFIYILNISGNFFLPPWCFHRHSVHHFEVRT